MELEGGTGNEGQHLADHPLLRTPFDGDHVTMEESHTSITQT